MERPSLKGYKHSLLEYFYDLYVYDCWDCGVKPKKMLDLNEGLTAWMDHADIVRGKKREEHNLGYN